MSYVYFLAVSSNISVQLQLWERIYFKNRRQKPMIFWLTFLILPELPTTDMISFPKQEVCWIVCDHLKLPQSAFKQWHPVIPQSFQRKRSARKEALHFICSLPFFLMVLKQLIPTTKLAGNDWLRLYIVKELQASCHSAIHSASTQLCS